MDSILTNSQALSALQSLNQTQQYMNITQNQVSTGLAVQTASDNAAYWSIGQQLTSANGLVNASNTALTQSQAIMDTASSAIASVITTIDSIQAQLTSASNPGASFSDINTALGQLSQQLKNTINSASFDGVNLLNSTQSAMSIVSGYNASASGGTVSTIAFNAQSLIGGTVAANATVSTSPTSVVTDSTLINLLNNAGPAATGGGAVAAGANSSWLVTSTDTATGLQAISTYTGYTSYNETTGGGTAATSVGAFNASTNPTGSATWTVQTTVTSGAATASSAGLLLQFGQNSGPGFYDLTNLGGAAGTQVSATNASDMLSAVNLALAAVRGYAATIGTVQDTMNAASTFNSALSTDYQNGLSALVDADMNTASTRLQALQTQEQLGIQSLSIANQNSQLILKLFNG